MGHRAVVLGASGFAGGELLRLLSRHPGINVVAAAAASRVGTPVADLYPWFADQTAGDPARFVAVEDALAVDADVVFSSLPHGASTGLFAGATVCGGASVVDLAGDFRLHRPDLVAAWYGSPPAACTAEELAGWVYGLTEWHRDEVTVATRVACPGCYPAATLLALAPLAVAGLLAPGPVHVTGLSGVSGAGRAGGEGFGYTAVNENLRAYAPTGHKHIAEIEQELAVLAGRDVPVSFVPHLVPMTRGLAVTCVAEAGAGTTTDDLLDAMRARYRGERFVRVVAPDALPETRRVSGTNVAEVSARVDGRTGRALVFGAVDNLGKGAAGQAVQNANLMLGYDEATALDVAAPAP